MIKCSFLLFYSSPKTPNTAALFQSNETLARTRFCQVFATRTQQTLKPKQTFWFLNTVFCSLFPRSVWIFFLNIYFYSPSFPSPLFSLTTFSSPTFLVYFFQSPSFDHFTLSTISCLLFLFIFLVPCLLFLVFFFQSPFS